MELPGGHYGKGTAVCQSAAGTFIAAEPAPPGHNADIKARCQQIPEMKPKVSYYDVVLNCKDLISTSAIAKDYGKSAIWMNRYLHEKGVQFKQGDIWLLYQRYAREGYTSTKTHTYPGTNGETHTKVHTYWTQKGRLFIYELMRSDGYMPLIELEV